jgi:hypothetical protein
MTGLQQGDYVIVGAEESISVHLCQSVANDSNSSAYAADAPCRAFRTVFDLRAVDDPRIEQSGRPRGPWSYGFAFGS